jgi:hypothetical protein
VTPPLTAETSSLADELAGQAVEKMFLGEAIPDCCLVEKHLFNRGA